MTQAKIDQNREKSKLASDENGVPQRLLVDPSTGRLLIKITKTATTASPVLNTTKIDENRENIALATQADETITPLHVDCRNNYLFCNINLE